MALTRDEKSQLIKDVTSELENCKAVIFSEYRGMTMKNTQEMRKGLRVGNIGYKVIKTTLLSIAMKNAKLAVPEEILKKPIAIAIGLEDEVQLSKLMSESAKKIESLKILGGIIDGKYVDTEVIKKLATLPSREELLGKLVGTIAAPLSGLVGVLQGNIRGLVVVLKQRQVKIG